MDLSEKLKQIVVSGRQAEMRSKNIMNLTEKKCELQKKLQDTSTTLKIKQENLTDLRREAARLETALSIVKAKEHIAKGTVKDLVMQVVIAEKETEDAQSSYWDQLNDFISNALHHLRKQSKVLEKRKVKVKIEGNERKQTLYKLEAELEASKYFEKYQNRKVEELKLIKEMLEI